MKDLYRLVYTSMNFLKGSEEERAVAVAGILAVSQHNNNKVSVTGALLFNGGSFAQVLEGPRKAVETTFERIQRDARHSDVSVLQCEPVETRGFSNWSMAFIGHSPRGRAMWNEVAARTGFDLSRIEGDELFRTLHAIVEEEEGLQTEALVDATVVFKATAYTEAMKADQAFPVERLRAELAEETSRKASTIASEHRPAGGPSLVPAIEPAENSGVAATNTESNILRTALVDERNRTSDLRRSLDEVRIALAVAHEEIEILRRHRDVWADRAKSLVQALCRDPELKMSSTEESEGHAGAPKMKIAV